MAERRIETSIDIDASPERVWEVLTDFSSMPVWNPFIRSIEGMLTPGARLAVHIVPPGKSGMRFRPTVLTAQPGRELRWLGHIVLPGLFDGEHYFTLSPAGADRCRFVHGEKFSGLLAGLIAGAGMLASTRRGFEAMNAALKQRAEQAR